MGRTYDRQLSCGCMLSSCGGGGVIPCCYPGYGASKEEEERCNKAWKEFKKSKDHKLFEQECIDNNNIVSPEVTKSDTAENLLKSLRKGFSNCDFSSLESGDITDLKKTVKDLEYLRSLKEENFEKIAKLADKEKPLKTIQRLMVMHDINVAHVYTMTQHLKKIFKW